MSRRRVVVLLVALLAALLAGVVSPRGLRADDEVPAPAPAKPEPGEPKPGEPGFDPAKIPAPAPGQVSLYAAVDLKPQGDGHARIEVHFAPADYAKVKAATPDPRKFLQDLRPGRSDSEIAPGAEAGYADDAHAVVLLMNELGAVKNLGEGRWVLAIGSGYTLLGSDEHEGRPRAFFEESGTWDSGVAFTGRYTYALPAGAREPNWDASAQALTWTLPSEPGSGAARLTVDLKVKDRLMTSVYKVYGLGGAMSAQWLAKGVFRNAGTGRLKNLRVRFRLDKYSEWSGWSKFPEVVPGQTVVALYHPVLDASIARLKSNTPADLRVAWSYEDANGKKEEDEDTQRLVLLGVNEFVFSNLVAGESFGTWQEQFNNAPLLAAWVSRNDAVVKQLAAMANRMAGGLGATTDDETAARVLAACYELLRANDFTYQHPPALLDKTVSFDVRQVQNVKFPRDTIRDRSGTCIDLAILYAAMANALGLEPHLALVPGHCFPVVRLPQSQQLVGVEVTGLQGGLRHGSAPFEQVLPKGTEELKEAMEDGRLYLIDLRDLWTRGMANPELDELPADVLERWGIQETGRGRPTSPIGGTADPVLGIFSGHVSETDEEGKTTTYPIRLGVDPAEGGRYVIALRIDITVDTAEGAAQIVFVEEGTGEKRGAEWAFRLTKRKLRLPGADEPTESESKNVLTMKVDGDTATARLGNDDEGWSHATLTREKAK
jgi:hypothetical protein